MREICARVSERENGDDDRDGNDEEDEKADKHGKEKQIAGDSATREKLRENRESEWGERVSSQTDKEGR